MLTHRAGGLLHHRFTLTVHTAVYFLLHYLAGCPEWLLATVLLYGARTFLVISAATVLPTHPSKDYLLEMVGCIHGDDLGSLISPETNDRDRAG